MSEIMANALLTGLLPLSIALLTGYTFYKYIKFRLGKILIQKAEFKAKTAKKLIRLEVVLVTIGIWIAIAGGLGTWLL